MTLAELAAQFAAPLLITLVLLLAAGGLTAWALTNRSKLNPRKKKAPDRGGKESRPTVGQVSLPDRNGLLELVRVYRDPRTRTLALGSGDRLYRRRGDLSVNQVDQLSVLMGELLAWLGKPELTRRAVQAQMDQTAGEELAGALPTLVIDQTGTPSPLHLINPLDALVKGVSAEVPRPSSQTSLAAQVDQILQAKLAESPYHDRAVRLMELPGKGMVVLVGIQQYENIDQVPDPEVRALIRQSVIEWEGKIRG